MEDTSRANDLAQKLGALVAEHNGQDLSILDLRKLNGWTDFFVIATVNSGVHAQGILRYIQEFAGEAGVETLYHPRKTKVDGEWNLVDFGSVVVHLMSAKAREFYELERLWSEP